MQKHAGTMVYWNSRSQNFQIIRYRRWCWKQMSVLFISRKYYLSPSVYFNHVCGLTWYHEPIIIMLFLSEKCKTEIAKNAK